MCGECDKKIIDEELEKYRIRNFGRNDFETGISRDERFLINKMHTKYIEKLQNDLEDVR